MFEDVEGDNPTQKYDHQMKKGRPAPSRSTLTYFGLGICNVFLEVQSCLVEFKVLVVAVWRGESITHAEV